MSLFGGDVEKHPVRGISVGVGEIAQRKSLEHPDAQFGFVAFRSVLADVVFMVGAVA